MTALDLCLALAALFADVPPARSCAAAAAIVQVARESGEDPALLAVLAHRESRFDATAVNTTSGACGPMAVLYSHDRAVQRRRCRAVLASELAGYRAGAAKLRDARAFCRRRGDTGDLCALAGFASGPAGVRGRWFRGPRRAIARARAVRAFVELPPVRGESGGAS